MKVPTTGGDYRITGFAVPISPIPGNDLPSTILLTIAPFLQALQR